MILVSTQDCINYKSQFLSLCPCSPFLSSLFISLLPLSLFFSFLYALLHKHLHFISMACAFHLLLFVNNKICELAFMLVDITHIQLQLLTVLQWLISLIPMKLSILLTTNMNNQYSCNLVVHVEMRRCITPNQWQLLYKRSCSQHRHWNTQGG